ncbi:hypothetical protein IQ266_27670 [filamentous cyanobacterium LEGE 11480]|uniref:Uncharacterized protein n=1 Tax=Romeriopsis navalis LEGE 11480 TaxID=2777977 RepID=A0A928VS61_9CYAN|nr:hypothetical protein [Romeriopsis navalis]MBE9033510.1 hypothetical protein [Romeriopsis navalis LEGE 11480]
MRRSYNDSYRAVQDCSYAKNRRYARSFANRKAQEISRRSDVRQAYVQRVQMGSQRIRRTKRWGKRKCYSNFSFNVTFRVKKKPVKRVRICNDSGSSLRYVFNNRSRTLSSGGCRTERSRGYTSVQFDKHYRPGYQRHSYALRSGRYTFKKATWSSRYSRYRGIDLRRG